MEIKSVLKAGTNTVTVEVANLWRNRLIYDSQLPLNERYTSILVSDVNHGPTPPASGLLGPVTIEHKAW